MRSFKTTIIALVVLVVAIGAFIGIKSWLDKDNDGEGTENTEVTSVNLFEVPATNDKNYNTVSIEAQNKEFFSFYLAEENWCARSHTDLEIYNQSVQKIIEVLVGIKGNVIADFESLDDYEINEKSPYTRLVFKDGTSICLRFGVADNSGKYRYVSVDGKADTVYRILETYAAQMMVTRGLLVNLTAFDVSDGFNASHLTIKKKGELVVDATGKFVPATSEDGEDTVEWTVVAPIRIAANNEAVNGLISKLNGIHLTALVDAECEDLSEYGLDNPGVEYAVVYADASGNTESKLIKLGNKTKDAASYYCTVDDKTNLVFTISASSISSDVKIETYIDGSAFREMYTSLKTVDVMLEGEKHEMKYVFKKDGDEEIEERYFDGQFVLDGEEYRDADGNTPENYFNHFLAALYAVGITTVDVTAPETKGELLFSALYTKTDNSTVKIELFKRDNTTAYVYQNGEYVGGYMRTNIRLYGEYVDFGVKGSLDKLKNAMK